MIQPVFTNQKIFKIDFSSDEDQSQIQVIEDQIKKNNEKFNPQTQSSYSNQKSKNSKLFKNSNIQMDKIKQNSQKIRYQPLRRNKSFKAKKQGNYLNKPKINFNKSVSKFGNIFQEAQQINLKCQSKFSVHQQTKGQQNLLRPISKIINQIGILRKNQHKPILKLSQNSKNTIHQSQSPKKTVRFLDNNDFNFRKTSYAPKPINEILQKKLSKTEYRPSSRIPKSQIQVRLRTQQTTDMKVFVHKKIHSSQVLITTIKKDTSGFNWLWPVYRMEDQKSKIHILSAKKKAANTTSNYYISTDQKQIDVQNAQYMGKVRSNFIGSCFNIFNQGLNPENIDHELNNPAKVRKLLATVIYESQVINANPKSMRVYMIKSPYSYYDLEGTKIKQQEKSLQQIYQIGRNKEQIHLFKNRQPSYNKKENRFVLSFDGRVKMPSTKNFILEDSQTKKQVLMFGKIKEDEYLMHISSPLTPHVAMGIVLSQLDSKIICD